MDLLFDNTEERTHNMNVDGNYAADYPNDTNKKNQTISMTRNLLLLLFTFYFTSVFGQTIIISTQPQKVPQGEKWTLTTQMQPLIEVNEGTLNSGTLCNAKILSNPKSVQAILEGEYGRPNKAYGINFNGLSKVAYTNDLTYKVSSISSFSCYDYNATNQDNRSSEKTVITFLPGQIVYVMGCLESIQMTESILSQNELTELKKKEILKKQNEIKEQGRQEFEEKNEKENDIKEKLTSGYAFDEFEIPNISNNTSPSLNCIDTLGLKSFILNCLFKDNKQLSITYNVTYDTLLNPIGLTKTITTYNQYDGTANGTKITNDFSCGEKEILDSLKKYFKLSASAKINFNRKTYSIPIVKHIWIKSQSKYYLTKQNVEIRKKKGHLNIEMTYANSFSGYEENVIKRNPFTDNSYIDKIKEYIRSNPPDTRGYNYGINYYARRTDFIIDIEYNNDEEVKHTFSNTIWKINQQTSAQYKE